MAYNKMETQYYLEQRDKDYINNKIHYYSEKINKKENKSREWFKISQYYYKKRRGSSSVKWRKIYTILARRCYNLYSAEKLEKKKDLKFKDFI
jgi:hypothetical protein